jgi:hypothetical protein
LYTGPYGVQNKFGKEYLYRRIKEILLRVDNMYGLENCEDTVNLTQPSPYQGEGFWKMCLFSTGISSICIACFLEKIFSFDDRIIIFDGHSERSK